MKCQRCYAHAEMMTTATWRDGTTRTVYHCFVHWDESFQETIRLDNLNREIARLEVRSLDEPAEEPWPPF